MTINIRPGAKKPRKYLNKPVVVDGERFDSRRELARYRHLALLQRAGRIADLQRQVAFELVPKQRRSDGKAERSVCYIADFVYIEDGERVVEDLKSEMTAKLSDYVIKRKLLLHVHGITLREVR
jgi:hypothetical protein